jgi:hypothetical protein
LRIARYIHREAESYGVIQGNDKIVDLPELAKIRGKTVPPTIDGLISQGSAAENLVKDMVDG